MGKRIRAWAVWGRSEEQPMRMHTEARGDAYRFVKRG